jgi:uncharacterized protein DUF4129
LKPGALAFGLLAVVLFPPFAPRAQVSVSAAEYLGRLDQARSEALAAVSAPSPNGMEAIRARLGLPLIVAFRGQQVRLERDPFLQALTGDKAEDFRAAARRLSVLRDRLRQALDRPTLSPSQLRAALDDAYRDLRTTRLGFLAQIRRAVSDLLSWVGTRIFSLRGPQTLIAWLVVLALLLPLIPLARRLGVVQHRTAPALGGTSQVPTDWHRLAEEALTRGDLRAAVRALYGALLASLSARGVLPRLESLTAGECRRAVATARPALYPAVLTATTAFERVIYGRAAPRPEDIHALREADRAARSS